MRIICETERGYYMSIVLVGGHDRMHRQYKLLSKEHGHKIKIMTQMKTEFTKRIGNPDGIIVFTNTVSHKMVKHAAEAAKKNNVPMIKCHTSSQNALKTVLEELERMI